MVAGRFVIRVSFVVLGVMGSAAFARAEMANERTTANTSCVLTAVSLESRTMTVKCEDAEAPVTYMITKDTLFVDAKGGVVPHETLENSSVTIHYAVEHDRMIANRVAASPR